MNVQIKKPIQQIVNKLLVISSCFMLIALPIKAETTKEGKEMTTKFKFESFDVKEINEKLYLKFETIENEEGISYLLESSPNGSDFYVVQFKKGYKSPNKTPLLYCFTVDLNDSDHDSYRIARVSSSNEKSYSSIIDIDNVKRSKMPRF